MKNDTDTLPPGTDLCCGCRYTRDEHGLTAVDYAVDYADDEEGLADCPFFASDEACAEHEEREIADAEDQFFAAQEREFQEQLRRAACSDFCCAIIARAPDADERDIDGLAENLTALADERIIRDLMACCRDAQSVGDAYAYSEREIEEQRK